MEHCSKFLYQTTQHFKCWLMVTFWEFIFIMVVNLIGKISLQCYQYIINFKRWLTAPIPSPVSWEGDTNVNKFSLPPTWFLTPCLRMLDGSASPPNNPIKNFQRTCLLRHLSTEGEKGRSGELIVVVKWSPDVNVLGTQSKWQGPNLLAFAKKKVIQYGRRPKKN